MKLHRAPALGRLALLGLAVAAADSSADPFQLLDQQNEALFQALQNGRGLSDEQMKAIRRIFAGSRYIGQGNPAVTQHPMTPEQCRAKLAESGVSYENPRFEKICRAKYMAPLY